MSEEKTEYKGRNEGQFELKPSQKIPLNMVQMDIVLDGVKLGEVRPDLLSSGEVQYHASFNASVSGDYHSNPLLQGFAPTRALAVQRAVESGRKEVEGRLKAVAEAEAYLPDLLKAVADLEGESHV